MLLPPMLTQLASGSAAGRQSGLVISGAHQVAEMQTYFILQAGVNTGLGDQGTVKEGVFQLGMLKKFQDSVNSVGRQYYQYMKREKPLRIQKRGDWMMSEDEYVNLLLCKWDGSVKHDQESISKIWVESRKVCERDAATVWNTLIAKYPDGKSLLISSHRM